MKITRILPKINFDNLTIKTISIIKNELKYNILTCSKTEDVKSYNEILSFINYLEKIKIITDNKDKIDYP
jgi:hypothetical protein